MKQKQLQEEPAGIIVTSTPNDEVNASGCGSYFEDIYGVPKYRGRGIAGDVFARFIRQQKHNTKKPTSGCS